MGTRSIRGRRIVDDSSSSSSDDELPDLRDIKTSKLKAVGLTPARSNGTTVLQSEQHSPLKSTVRRRKLGAISDNPLLRPLGDSSSSSLTPVKNQETAAKKKSTTPQRIELRTRQTQPTSLELDDYSEAGSILEETILEDFSGSDFAGSQSTDEEDDDSMSEDFFSASPSKSKRIGGQPKTRNISRERTRSPSPSAQLLAEAIEAKERDDISGAERSTVRGSKSNGTSNMTEGTRRSPVNDLADPLSQLHINGLNAPRSKSPQDKNRRSGTPPSPDANPKPKHKGLASPSKKISRIPATPHHAHTDTFWSQEFIDEWNDEHSPKKQLFPPLTAPKSPTKPSSPQKGQPSQAAVQKAAKKAFEQAKHDLADEFLLELDQRITKNELSELSSGTGGIRIDWTSKLLTTAGRANWKRETIKSKATDGETTVSTRYRHHASIELSTKVIDDENRLLNVIAHEFCHLANFMISGITTNPHGKEFKAWAAKVTSVFGHRGIDVTTKHSYEIDFKYVWECTACAMEFKRHSKSINPERHRCGACKSELKQTKPVPRSNKGKESEYQKFMKEQMRLIRAENPGSPQKDIMKVVASRWAQRVKTVGEGDSTVSSQSSDKQRKVEGVTRRMSELAVVDLA